MSKERSEENRSPRDKEIDALVAAIDARLRTAQSMLDRHKNWLREQGELISAAGKLDDG